MHICYFGFVDTATYHNIQDVAVRCSNGNFNGKINPFRHCL